MAKTRTITVERPEYPDLGISRETDGNFGGVEESGAGEASATGDSTGAKTINGIPVFDPANAEATDTSGIDYRTGEIPIGEPKRRGRKPGSKNAPKTQNVALHLEGIEALLISIHFMGASILNIEELALEKNEAKMLSQSIANVARLYPHNLSEKTIAWANLMMVCGGVYGTRIVAYRSRTKQERRPKLVPPQPATKQANGAPFVPTDISQFGVVPPKSEDSF